MLRQRQQGPLGVLRIGAHGGLLSLLLLQSTRTCVYKASLSLRVRKKSGSSSVEGGRGQYSVVQGGGRRWRWAMMNDEGRR